MLPNFLNQLLNRPNYVPCEKGDVVVVKFNDHDNQREEVLVLIHTGQDLLIARPSTSTLLPSKYTAQWVPKTSVTSNLGSKYWTEEKLEQLGLKILAPKQDSTIKPPLVTGTFIEEEDDEFFLVEIDRIAGIYIIHRVNDSQGWIIKPDHEYILHTFSKPEEGSYSIDPGMYINPDTRRLIEVVPFKGKCWYRTIDDSLIQELHDEFAIRLSRIETDDDGMDYYLINELPTGETPKDDTKPQCGQEQCICGDPTCSAPLPKSLFESEKPPVNPEELFDPKDERP